MNKCSNLARRYRISPWMLDERRSMRAIHLIERQKLTTDTDVSWHSSWVYVRVPLLIEVEVGDEKKSGLLLQRKEQAQIPDNVIQWSVSTTPDETQRWVQSWCKQWPDLTLSIAQRWGWGGDPALQVCSIRSQWGWGGQWGRELGGDPRWRGVNMGWPKPFCLVNKWATCWYAESDALSSSHAPWISRHL